MDSVSPLIYKHMGNLDYILCRPYVFEKIVMRRIIRICKIQLFHDIIISFKVLLVFIVQITLGI